jgi:hypothetical protein
MQLTERAMRYLERQDRVERVPTATVAALLRESGTPAFDSWLDFHERYSGYVEVIGPGDVAVLGLAQVERYSHWTKACSIDVSFYEEEEGEEALYKIVCADAHPSYGYQLDHKGQFFGPSGRHPATESYDRRVEQTALYREAKQTEGWDPVLRTVPPNRCEKLLAEVAEGLVRAASDQYSAWYVTSEWLVVRDAISGRCRACGRKDAVAQLKK